MCGTLLHSWGVRSHLLLAFCARGPETCDPTHHRWGLCPNTLFSDHPVKPLLVTSQLPHSASFQQLSGTFMICPLCSPVVQVRLFVALLATLCQSPAGGASASDPRQTDPAALVATADVIRTMRELGAAHALAAALRSVSPDHPLSSSTTAAVLKPLEVIAFCLEFCVVFGFEISNIQYLYNIDVFSKTLRRPCLCFTPLRC